MSNLRGPLSERERNDVIENRLGLQDLKMYILTLDDSLIDAEEIRATRLSHTTQMEAVAAMMCDEIEEMYEKEQPDEGLPLQKRKDLVELLVRRFDFFYDLGAQAQKAKP